MRLLLATNNRNKARELLELSRRAHDVVTLDDVGLGDIDVVEDAPDFAGNALKKAREIKAAVQARGVVGIDVVVADDSGLCVDALDGRPGVRSARFANDVGYFPPGVARDDKNARNNRLLLALLGALPMSLRRAYFVSHVCALRMTSDSEPITAQGTVHGVIAMEPRGAHGFGYDPLFIVDDDDATALRGKHVAELSSEQKHSISHRGRAMRLLLAHI